MKTKCSPNLLPARFLPRSQAVGRRGFTLVELLLVLAILAILAGIIYPNYARRGEHARVTATQTQIASLKGALATFEVDNGYYPHGPGGLVELVVRPASAANWHGPYLETVPKDAWGREFTYVAPGKVQTTAFDIISAGPDGRFGTADDITNYPERPGKH